MPKISWIIDLKSGQSVYEAQKVQRAIEGIGKAAGWSGKSIQQLTREQEGFVRQLTIGESRSGERSHFMPSEAYLRQQTQMMLRTIGSFSTVAKTSSALPIAGLSQMINSQLGIGAQQYRPKRTEYEDFWKSAVPPHMAPVNRGLAGLGIGAGLFSPWIGATMLNQSGIFGSGGGGNGPLGKLLGGAGVGGFGIAYLALQLSTRLLKTAFDELRNAVKNAAQLFVDAAKLRVSPGRLMQTRTMLSALGVEHSQEVLEALMYRKGGASSMYGALAGLSGQPNAARYISRVTSGDEAFWNKMAANSQALRVAFGGLNYEIQKLITQSISSLIPALTGLAVSLQAIMSPLLMLQKWSLAYFEILARIGVAMGGSATAFAFTPIPTQGFGDLGKGMPSIPMHPKHISSWERMGFVIGTGGNTALDYARQTAQNTKIIADKILMPGQSNGPVLQLGGYFGNMY